MNLNSSKLTFGKITLVILGLLFMSSCGKQPTQINNLFEDTSAIKAEPPKPNVPSAPKNYANSDALIAYSYNISILLPKENIDKISSYHRAICEKAGYNKCRVISSNTTDTSANLSIRAEPTFLKGFRDSLGNDAKDNKGKIISSETTSEDLTFQITDTEAKLRAKNILKERIEKIIASQPAKLADLLEAETKLAEVQADIDSTNSNLAVDRTRVNMSVLDLNYQTRDTSGLDVFEPLNEAFGQFFYVMSQSLSFLILAFAGILPFSVVIVPIVFFFIFLHKKRIEKEKKKDVIVNTKEN